MAIPVIDPKEIIRSGVGERRFELRRGWREHLPFVLIFVAFCVLITLEDGFDPQALLVVLAIMISLSLVLWPRANYIIIHPTRVDTSVLMFGSKMKSRRRHRIPYEDIVQVSSSEAGELKLTLRPSSKLMQKIGVDSIPEKLHLRHAQDAALIREAVELGRDLAREQPARTVRSG